MEDFDVSTLTWGTFLIVTQQAAAHLGTIIWIIYIPPKISHKEQWNNCSMWQESWSKSRKKCKENPWSIGKTILGKGRLCWLTGQFGYQQRKPEYSPCQYCAWEESVKIPLAHGRKKIDWFLYSSQCRESDRIDGEPMEFEWKISQDSLHCRFSQRYRTWWLKHNVYLGNSQEGSSSCQCTATLYGEKKELKTCVLRIPKSCQNMQEDSRTYIGRFFRLDQKRNGTEPTRTSRMENGIESLRTWCSTSVKVDIPYSVDPVLWNEEIWKKKKGKGQLSKHFCGDDYTAELVLRTIISVNQLSNNGAVADMCDELACRISDCSESTGKLVAQNNSETMVMPTELSTTNKTPRTNETAQGDLLHDYEQKFANLPDHLQLIKLCSNVGITKTVARGQ